jgi:proton-dependent oligopeptide transporter, POT family
MSAPAASPEGARPSPWKEISQPFVDLVRAPRALWAVNVVSLTEGFAYFGILTYLAMYFNKYALLPDKEAGWMVGLLTSGVTLCMLLFGGTADRFGIRRTVAGAIVLMLAGRLLLSFAPTLGLASGGLASPFNATAALAIVFAMIGYGIYYPATYAAVRKLAPPAMAGMSFAMLYAVMNLGGWLPTFMSEVRQRYEIRGAFLVYAAASLTGLVVFLVLLTRATEERAAAEASAAAKENAAANENAAAEKEGAAAGPGSAAAPAASGFGRVLSWLRNHPLADPKFAAFIFFLMPVQTLFAYNWLILPQYVSRAFAGGWVGERFELATQLNSLLIFVLCPIVAALSTRVKVYTMMIWGTAVMALPAFFLALGPTVPGLFGYVAVMTLGEAMWQPRFLQFAAEIAPEGRTGAYMGVAQFPWFLTKTIVPLYSGAALARWCPEPGKGIQETGTMWLVFGLVAICSTVLLLLARGWLGKDFRTRA